MSRDADVAAWSLRRWIAIVTLGEAIGYLGPAGAGIATAGAGAEGWAQVGALALAGGFEGALLGLAQWWALAPCVDVGRRRWVARTAVGASLTWAAVMSMPALASSGAGGPLLAAGFAALGVVAALAIAVLQWSVLRRRVDGAIAWLWWTPLAWALALPLSFAPSPLVDEGTALVVHLLLWPVAGLAMALVMATVTGVGMSRIVRRQRTPRLAAP